MFINKCYFKKGFVSLLTLAALMGSSEIALGSDSSDESLVETRTKRQNVSMQFPDHSSEENDETDGGFCLIPVGSPVQKGKRDAREEQDEKAETGRQTKAAAQDLLKEFIDEEDDVAFLFPMLAEMTLEQCAAKNSKPILPLAEAIRLAENGDPSGCYELGKRYFDGIHGVQQDYLEACKYFIQAGYFENSREMISTIHEYLFRTAKYDDMKSAYTLGLMYTFGGYGLERNLPLAFQYFTKANGYKDSQKYLANYSKDNN